MADWVLGVARLIFVRQHKIRDDGSRLETQFMAATLSLHQDFRAAHIRRHQVRGELNAAESQVEGFAEGMDQQRLANARNSFKQHVPASKERSQDGIDHFVLAHDGLMQFCTHFLVDFAESGGRGLGGCGAFGGSHGSS